jgi:hypothetical protein
MVENCRDFRPILEFSLARCRFDNARHSAPSIDQEIRGNFSAGLPSATRIKP